MLLRIIAILLFFHSQLPLVAQGDADSVYFRQADEAFSIAFSNTDSALQLANKVLRKGEQLKNKRVIANAWNAIGWAFMHKGNLDTAIYLLEKSVALFQSANDNNSLVRVKINLAEVYTRQSRIANAVKQLVQADSVNKTVGSILYGVNINRQFGIVYREAKDYQKAAAYFRQAMDGFSKLGDNFKYLSTVISLSILYRNMNMPDSSLALLQRCVEMASNTPNSGYQMAMVNEHLGENYLLKHNYQKALKHFTDAYQIFQRLNNKADMAYEAFCIGRTYVKLQQLTNAESYFLQSYHINDSLKMINYQYDVAVELAQLYQVKKEWEKGFRFSQKAMALKDSLAYTEQLAKTNELVQKFESEKKEQEIQLLKAKNELSDASNRRNRMLQYVFIMLFIFSVAIGWLLVNRLRIKRRLQEQVLRNQIAGDLHDDIGSALSSIDISSRIALDKKDNAEVMLTQMQKIRQYTRHTMESMSDIVWSINPANDNFESVLMRMREFASELCEPQSVNLVFETPAEVEAVKLSAEVRKDLFLLFKEAVNNAIKYSHCTELKIHLQLTGDNHLLMEVIDNGTGFDEASVKKGNGLKNMQARAAHMQGRLSITAAADKGTTIALYCPLLQ